MGGDLSGTHVVVIGNVVAGVRIVGPFKTGVAAVEWAGETVKGEDWHVVRLNAPDSEQG